MPHSSLPSKAHGTMGPMGDGHQLEKVMHHGGNTSEEAL